MAHLIHIVVAFARGYPFLAYMLAFLLSGAESFPVFGALVPGTAAIVALGALVPANAVLFWPLVLAATLGAVAGDGFSYWLGHRYKEAASQRWPLRRHPGLLNRGEAFFEKHGGKAIVIARFTPGVRAIVPLVAGITGMAAIRFYSLNILSAVLWAPAHVLMGVIVGATLTILGAVAGRLEALFLGLFLAVAALAWLTPRLLGWFVAILRYLRGPVLIWARSRDGWLGRRIMALLDPERTELAGLAILGALLVGSLWLFFGVMQDLIAGDPLVQADRAVAHFLLLLRVEWLAQVAVAISEFGSGPVALAVVAATLLWLDRQHAWRAMGYELAAAAGAISFAAGLDLALRRPAPLYHAPGWGILPFPGTHLAVFAALLGFLAMVACRGVTWRRQIAAALATGGFLAALAFSRLYLGADYLSTALEVLAFGMAWAALLSIFYLMRAAEPAPVRGLGAVIALAISVAGGAAVVLGHASDMRRYAVVPQTVTYTEAEWLNGAWTRLPVRRLSLLGSFERPFVMQWLGSLHVLSADLERQGWQVSSRWRPISALQFLAPRPNPALLPVLPSFESGRVEGLAMIRTGHGLPADERVVLRLWRSDAIVPEGAGRLRSIWIGTLGIERVGRMFSLVNVPQGIRAPDSLTRAVAAALPGARLRHRPRHGGKDGVILAMSPEAASKAASGRRDGAGR